jgi:uncharacterized protein YbjT (DUF2867 family)
MVLLTGATGNVGSAVLRRLTASGARVRCLVRDPRRLGAQRVRVQIALGDLAEPASFRNALRGIETVVHLAAAIRDQPRASIEELNGVATLRLVRAAERAGAKRFLFFSALGASEHAAARFMRAKALSEATVEASGLDSVVFAPSIIYSPHDYFITLMRRMTLLPAVPIAGSGTARYQPISADDCAECLLAVLRGEAPQSRLELAGPEILTYDDVARTLLSAFHRRRRLLHVPMGVTTAGLRLTRLVMREAAFATAEEAELMAIDMLSARGTRDAEALGVHPRAMAEVLSEAYAQARRAA